LQNDRYIFPSRKEIIKQKKAEGKLIAAVYPVHYPRELLKAFGIHPIEVWGPANFDITKSRVHLQSYVCSIMHSALSLTLSHHFDDVDLIIVPHCCDTLQGIGSILKDFINLQKPVFTFYIPRGRRKSDVEFLASEIKRLFALLVKITHLKPNMDDLIKSIENEEKIERLILKAYKKHIQLNSNASLFYKIIRGREFLPDDIFIENLKNFLSESNKKSDLKRVVLSGLVPEPAGIFDLINSVGGNVVDDDFACLKRRLYLEGKSTDPFVRMAQRIINGPPDSLKGNTFEERFEFLKNMAKNSNSDGVIFYHIKFCEPERFYYPILRDKLKSEGIKTLSVEVDINENLSEQIKTRIAAFIEEL